MTPPPTVPQPSRAIFISSRVWFTVPRGRHHREGDRSLSNHPVQAAPKTPRRAQKKRRGPVTLFGFGPRLQVPAVRRPLLDPAPDGDARSVELVALSACRFARSDLIQVLLTRLRLAFERGLEHLFQVRRG